MLYDATTDNGGGTFIGNFSYLINADLLPGRHALMRTGLARCL
jgi:hypothetical protein